MNEETKDCAKRGACPDTVVFVAVKDNEIQGEPLFKGPACDFTEWADGEGKGYMDAMQASGPTEEVAFALLHEEVYRAILAGETNLTALLEELARRVKEDRRAREAFEKAMVEIIRGLTGIEDVEPRLDGPFPEGKKLILN